MKFIYFLEGEKPFVMKLDIVKISNLYLHEEIVESHINKLYSSLTKENILRNPILVDEMSNVVLDGTHRVYALKLLGYKYIPAVLVDYKDSRIGLKRWFRVLVGSESVLEDILRKHGFVEGDIDYLSFGSEDMIIILIGEMAYVYQLKDSIVELYRKLSSFEKELLKSGIKIRYVTAREALKAWKKGHSIIITPTITKDDVISSARSGLLYPPKTTRHIFPVRPLFLDFPLVNLKGSFSEELLREVLREHVLGKIYLKINGKITVDRFYEEDKIILFV